MHNARNQPPRVFQRVFQRMFQKQKRQLTRAVFFVVRIRGLEPPPSCPDSNLNLTRLPIPPYPHILFSFQPLGSER